MKKMSLIAIIAVSVMMTACGTTTQTTDEAVNDTAETEATTEYEEETTIEEETATVEETMDTIEESETTEVEPELAYQEIEFDGMTFRIPEDFAYVTDKKWDGWNAYALNGDVDAEGCQVNFYSMDYEGTTDEVVANETKYAEVTELKEYAQNDQVTVCDTMYGKAILQYYEAGDNEYYKGQRGWLYMIFTGDKVYQLSVVSSADCTRDIASEMEALWEVK